MRVAVGHVPSDDKFGPLYPHRRRPSPRAVTTRYGRIASGENNKFLTNNVTTDPQEATNSGRKVSGWSLLPATNSAIKRHSHWRAGSVCQTAPSGRTRRLPVESGGNDFQGHLVQKAALQLRKLSGRQAKPGAIVVTDAAGAIEYVNPKFTELTGYMFEEALGKNPRILKSGKTPPEEYVRLWNTITSAATGEAKSATRRKTATILGVRVDLALRQRGGVTSHYVAVKEDITERKRRRKGPNWTKPAPTPFLN